MAFSSYSFAVVIPNPNPLLLVPAKPRSIQAVRITRSQINPTAHTHNEQQSVRFKLPLQLAASVVLCFGLGVRISSAASTQLPPSPIVAQQDQLLNRDGGGGRGGEDNEDEKLKQAFGTWKSKTYSLTVPLRVVSLQNSVPQSWVKDFIRTQGKRLKFQMNLCSSIEGIFNNLSVPFNKVKAKSSAYIAADLVSVGDSWLSFAIKRRLIEPITGAEDQDWFKCLSRKWKVYLRRNDAGEIDPQGKIWAAPYRWGTMVIAYKKSKFQKHKLAPIKAIVFKLIYVCVKIKIVFFQYA